MDPKLYLPTNDYIFKRLFSEHTAVLGDFLMAVLALPVEELDQIDILNAELSPEQIGDKLCILDIRLHTQSGMAIDIEVQVQQQAFIWKRMQYYTAKLLTEEAKKGDEYTDLPRVVGILIADFSLIRENTRYHHRFKFYDEEASLAFPDSMEIHVLELPKATQPDGSPLYGWMRFFQAKDKEDFEMVAQTNPVLAEAWGVVKTLNADERARLIAESREKAQMDLRSMIGNATREGLEKGLQTGRIEGLQTGLQQGRVEGLQTGRIEGLQTGLQQGRAEGLQTGRIEGLQTGRVEGIQVGKLEVARSLLQMGMPLSDIARVTQLPLDEIEHLMDDLKH